MHLFSFPAVACLLAWLYLALAHGRFWIPERASTSTLKALENLPRVAVIIPARNEADVIGGAITSLLRQTYTGPVHIFLVDDNSTDATPEITQQAASALNRRDSLTVIDGQPLRQGWSGKLWAVQQGVDHAVQLRPQFLLLTDADIQHSPDNIARLVTLAETSNYDLVSFMVKLHCQTFPEKLLIPSFVFFFFLLYPPRWIRNPHRRTAGAAGGCILIRPHALARAGGIAAIHHEIIDDCALARAVKRTGGRVWLGVTPDTVSLRAYNTLREIEGMIARSAFNQLDHSVWLLLLALFGMAFLYVFPLALVLSASPLLVILGLLAFIISGAIYLPMVRFYRLNALWVLTLPLSAFIYMASTLHSAINYWSGRGGEWKGRAQDSAK